MMVVAGVGGVLAIFAVIVSGFLPREGVLYFVGCPMGINAAFGPVRARGVRCTPYCRVHFDLASELRRRRHVEPLRSVGGRWRGLRRFVTPQFAFQTVDLPRVEKPVDHGLRVVKELVDLSLCALIVPRRAADVRRAVAA